MKAWLITIAAAILLVLIGAAYELGWTAPLLHEVLDRTGLRHGSPHAAAQPHRAPDRSAEPRLTPEGLLDLAPDLQQAIGLRTAEVGPQVEPIQIELLGTTDYIPDSMTKVRPRFDTLVREVFVTLGRAVQEGEPLVELYSAQLAEAKTTYQIAETQWEHDRRLRDAREPLARENAISQREWIDTQNQEIHSRLQSKVARDKLLVYGLSDEQIDAMASEDGPEKAKMTIRAPASGIVISRDAVPGNIYGPDDVLLVIAPLDRLWVWGNVYESDLPLVGEGQAWQIRFPYLDLAIEGRVEYVSDQVDPITHAVRIRGSIANPGGRFKADMLVSTLLEIPPEPGRTTIPRIAMVVADGGDYVFVRRSGARNLFERRAVVAVHELADRVVVGEGLQPGEVVVTEGSLLLAQVVDGLAISANPAGPGQEPGAGR